MRALTIMGAFVLALGAALFAGNMQFNRMANARADVAVRAGPEIFLIPAKFVRTDRWRSDLLRVAGCWDARDAAMVAGLSTFAGCDAAHRVPLALPTSMFGADVAMGMHKPQIAATFWPNYQPPADETAELAEAWAGRGVWAGRRSTLRADWQMWRVETPASPWIYLLSNAPQRGGADELSRLYTGRCYRPEKASDAGMTCSFALHVGASAVLEFALGADDMMSFGALREALMTGAGEWRKAVNGSSAPSA